MSKEEQAELGRRAAEILSDYASFDESPISLPRRVAEEHDKAILDSFDQIQQIHDSTQEGPTTPFCLHPIAHNQVAFGEAIKARQREQRETQRPTLLRLCSSCELLLQRGELERWTSNCWWKQRRGGCYRPSTSCAQRLRIR